MAGAGKGSSATSSLLLLLSVVLAASAALVSAEEANAPLVLPSARAASSSSSLQHHPCLDNPPDMTATGAKAGQTARDFHGVEAYLTGSRRAPHAIVLGSDYYGQSSVQCSLAVYLELARAPRVARFSIDHFIICCFSLRACL
jgi:hypothetical protein